MPEGAGRRKAISARPVGLAATDGTLKQTVIVGQAECNSVPLHCIHGGTVQLHVQWGDQASCAAATQVPPKSCATFEFWCQPPVNTAPNTISTPSGTA